MQATVLRYLDEMDRTESGATVLTVERDGEKDTVVLDQTIFYPQGGGQPSDQGTIEGEGGRFVVDETRFLEGVVRHVGRFESGSFLRGDPVCLRVDSVRRTLHTRLHSAGHVVDMAVTAQGLGWVPGKGFHFPQGPYVEYEGDLGEHDGAGLQARIEIAANELLGRGMTTSVRSMSIDEIRQACHFVPDYVPTDRPSRVVFYGKFGVPCGGTHVARLDTIGRITIRKIRQSGSTIRVSYAIESEIGR